MPSPKRLYKRKYNSSKKNYSKSKYTKRPTVSTTVKRYVKKAISRTEEIKNVVTTLSDLQTGNYAYLRPFVVDPGCGIISLTEAIDNVAQGTGQGERIGNRIMLKRNLFKGYFYALNNGATGGFPTNVTMYIGRLKVGISTPTLSALAQLFQAGDTTFGPTDDNRSSLYAINKDLWNVYYRRTFKIGGSTPTSANAVPNNDYKALMKFSVDVSKWMPKRLHYNDNNNVSTNAGLYAWFTISNYNDQPITGAYTPQVQYVAINDLSFSDA